MQTKKRKDKNKMADPPSLPVRKFDVSVRLETHTNSEATDEEITAEALSVIDAAFQTSGCVALTEISVAKVLERAPN